MAFCAKTQCLKASKAKILLVEMFKTKYKIKPEKIKNVSIFSMNGFFNSKYLKIKAEPIIRITELKKSTIFTG